jgi:hypothetical protein
MSPPAITIITVLMVNAITVGQTQTANINQIVLQLKYVKEHTFILNP